LHGEPRANFHAPAFVEFIDVTAGGSRVPAIAQLNQWSSKHVQNIAKSIHDFAANGDTEAVRAALTRGIHVDARNERGYTPLACAVTSPSVTAEMLSLLIENGANVNAPIENGKSFPLGLAACTGNLELTRLLLDAGASVNAATASGYTALVNCIYRLYDSDRLIPIIELLVEHGANVDCETDYRERPISVASRLGRFDAVSALIDAGADTSALEWSAVATAAAIGSDDELSRALSSNGLDNEPDRFGRTPGMLAAIVGSVTKGELLASYGWDVNEQGGRNQETALICSAAAKRPEMSAWLIAQGAELDAVDNSKCSALHHAAQAGCAECVHLLLEAGVNPQLVNEYGDTAMSSATTVDVVRRLQSAGEDLCQISTDMKRMLTGLSGYEAIDCSQAEYEAGKHPRPGNANPQLMDVPFWRAMVRAGSSAYHARTQFGDTREYDHPIWCFSRFGSSFTELPDGRFVQIGGEHEDWYDADFCIYNDVVVHSASGEFSIYGYPKKVFQPTDFHTATYVDGSIYLVGCLGYQGTRVFGTTPVYRLSCTDWCITKVTTRGHNPGWVYKHCARLLDSDNLVVSGGMVAIDEGGKEEHRELVGEFVLNLSTMTWSAGN
jgi:ankyrin repeat protein